MPDEPQQVYNGRYELHRRIARGGMAEVFLARDKLLDRPVALKVLFPEFATDPPFVERFRREGQPGGGRAGVSLARDKLLDRPVALKVLFPEFATDPSFVERFRREAQSAANLSHPNIVSVYDWGEEDGTYFIVMEYVEGRSLAQIIRDEGPLHPDRAAAATADTAAAPGPAPRHGRASP